MSRIKEVKEELPGIVSLFNYKPDVAAAIRTLVEIALRKSSIESGKAEALAGFVSNLNNCEFCERTHAWTSKFLGETEESLRKNDISTLAKLVGVVTLNQTEFIDPAIKQCKEQGYTDENIHDVVLIGALFSMLNRYVCMLTTNMGTMDEHRIMAEHMAENGYLKE